MPRTDMSPTIHSRRLYNHPDDQECVDSNRKKMRSRADEQNFDCRR